MASGYNFFFGEGCTRQVSGAISVSGSNSEQLIKWKDQVWILQQNQCVTRNMERVRREKPDKPSRPILIVNCSPICFRWPSVRLYFKTVQMSHHDFCHYSKFSFDDLFKDAFICKVSSKEVSCNLPLHLFFSVGCAGGVFWESLRLCPN